jgi:hypothetical protein
MYAFLFFKAWSGPTGNEFFTPWPLILDWHSWMRVGGARERISS